MYQIAHEPALQTHLALKEEVIQAKKIHGYTGITGDTTNAPGKGDRARAHLH